MMPSPNKIRFLAITTILILAAFTAPAMAQQSKTAHSLVEESNTMRRLLVDRYSESERFGELLSKNSKIRGAALRLKGRLNSGADGNREAASLDELLFDLESLLEQTNFEDSLDDSKEVSSSLGRMVSIIALIRKGSPADSERLTGTTTKKPVADPGSLELPKKLLETEFAPLQPPPTATPARDLNSPLVLGPSTEARKPSTDLSLTQQPTIGVLKPAPSQERTIETIELPLLTKPSPSLVENQFVPPIADPEIADPNIALGNQTGLRPFEPSIDGPRPLNYGNVLPSTNRRLAIPIQFEFYSFNPGGFFGYQPYGGYRSYGGYGSGRGCPLGR